MSIKLGFAREKLKENPWYFFKIIFKRKCGEIICEEKSKIYKLEEKSIELKDCHFNL